MASPYPKEKVPGAPAVVTHRTRILRAMAEEERKAWAALARYKFWMFGYHASGWVKLAHLISPRPANPFAGTVALARRYTAWPPQEGDDDEATG